MSKVKWVVIAVLNANPVSHKYFAMIWTLCQAKKRLFLAFVKSSLSAEIFNFSRLVSIRALQCLVSGTASRKWPEFVVARDVHSAMSVLIPIYMIYAFSATLEFDRIPPSTNESKIFHIDSYNH